MKDEKIIELLDKKNLISVEGDFDGTSIRLNDEEESWCGETILDIFKEGMKITAKTGRKE